MKFLLLATIVCTLFTVGCAGPWVPRGFQRPDDARVHLIHPDLRGIIRVDDVVTDYTIDGRLWAKAKIRNKSGRQLHLLVRTTFKDRADNSIDEDAEWRTLLIQPHETFSYNQKAISTEATEYLIEINKGTSY